MRYNKNYSVAKSEKPDSKPHSPFIRSLVALGGPYSFFEDCHFLICKMKELSFGYLKGCL